MCDQEIDPRDAVATATDALQGLCLLVGECDDEVPARPMAALLRLVYDRLAPADMALAKYRPLDWRKNQ